jgi:hypothetical protein
MSDMIVELQRRIDGGHVMGLNSRKIQNVDIMKSLRDQLKCEVPTKTTRTNKSDKTLSGDIGVGRWYVAYRKDFSVDLEKELFDHKM